MQLKIRKKFDCNHNFNEPVEFSCLGTTCLSGFLSSAVVTARDKLFASVVKADRAFNLGMRGMVRRLSIAQSVPVFGPLSLRYTVISHYLNE